MLVATHVGFISLGLGAIVRAVRAPGRATIDAALFFGLVACISAVTILYGNGAIENPVVDDVRQALRLALPLALLRVLGGFIPLRRGVSILYTVVWAACVALAIAGPPVARAALVLGSLYIFIGLPYVAFEFALFARRATGIVRRRMEWLGIGTLSLVAAGVARVLEQYVPGTAPFAHVALLIAALGTGVGYFLGLTPPPAVRRIWHFEAFTDVLKMLAAEPLNEPVMGVDTRITQHIAASFGAPRGAIAFWRPDEQAVLSGAQRLEDIPSPSTSITNRVYEAQRALYVEDVQAFDPANAEMYRRWDTRTILAAPVSIGERRFGVLALFGPSPRGMSPEDLPALEAVAHELATFLVRREVATLQIEASAQAEAALLKDDFLAAVSHDVRTPLTALMVRAQLLARRFNRADDSESAEAVEALVADGRRVQRLVETLLDVVKAEGGRFTSIFEPHDLRHVVDDVVSSMIETQHTIEVHGDATAEVDAERLAEVVQNLLDNALKFSKPGTPIDITVDGNDSNARIVIEDRGVGLTSDDLTTIFNRFQRGSAAQHAGGAGVGLYVSHRIVEEHGGTLTAEQREGGGSRFIITLPVEVPQLAAEPADASMLLEDEHLKQTSPMLVPATNGAAG